MKEASRAGMTWLLAAAALLGLAATLLFALDGARRVAEGGAAIRLEETRLHGLHELQSALQDAEAARRDYLLTGEAPYLAPYRDALDGARARLSALEPLGAAEPEAAAALERMRGDMAARFTELAQAMASSLPGERQQATERVRSGEGKAAMDRLRADVAGLLAQRRARMTALSLGMEAAAARARVLQVVAISLMLAFAGIAALMALRTRRDAEAGAFMALDALRARANEMERLSDAFVAATGEVVVQIDPVTRRGRMTGAVDRLLGIRPPATDAEFEARIHPDDLDATRARYRHGMSSGTPFDAEFRFRHGDGGWRGIRVRGAPVRDADGNLTAFVAVMRDVTAEKQGDVEREALGQRLRDLLDSIRDGFVAFDRELRYTYVNPTAEAMFGMPASQMLGRGLLEVFPQARGLDFHLACERVLATGRPEQMEQHYLPHDRWYGNHLYPTAEGLAVFFEDNSAAHQVRAQLAAERNRLAAIYEQSGAGICEISLDNGRFLAANERFCEIYGRPRDQVLRCRVGDHTHPDDRPALERRLQELREGRDQPRSVEKRILRPDGTAVWVSITNCLVRAQEGKPSYFVSVLQDVTERRIATDALARSEQRLEVYSRELARAVENERTRIAREIHDELGQSITGLKLDLAWLGRRIRAGDGASAAVHERLDEIQLHLDDTVHAVRRIATDLRPAALDELGLGAALRAHVGEFVRRAGLEADVKIDDVAVSTDGATALFRIAQEALTNVARHADARRVRVSLSEHSGSAILEVEDDGQGTASETRPDLPGGFGVVGIIERARLAGGAADVDSRPGEGTKVRAHVPCRAAALALAGERRA